jgi:hypothetical protein
MEKFFNVVNKINSVVFLLVLLGALTLLVITSLKISTNQKREADLYVEADKNIEGKSELEYLLSDFVAIDGAEISYSLLKSTGGYSKISSSRTKIYNVMFVSNNNLKSWWLFDHNNNLILSIRNIFMKGIGDSKITKALIVSVIKKDTNNDGMLSNGDIITVAMIKPNGYGYKELFEANKVVDYKVISKSSLLMMTKDTDDLMRLRKISLNDFSIIAERQVKLASDM